MNVPRIVVVGSVNTDMVVKGERLPGPGETVTGGQFVMAAGGKGANQAVAAARLGAEVTLVAKVGRDMFGDQAIENFRREGIRTDCILRDPDQCHRRGLDPGGRERREPDLRGLRRESCPDAAGSRTGGRSHPRGRRADAPVGNPPGCGMPGGANCRRGGRAGDPRPGPRGAAARRPAEARHLPDAQRIGGRAADRHCGHRRGHGPQRRRSGFWRPAHAT